MTGSPEPLGRYARPAVTVLTVAVGLQCLRVLFPVAYTFREQQGIAAAAAVALLVFLAPALSPVLVRLVPPRALLVAVAGALVVARLVLQVAEPIRIGVAAAGAAVGLLAITVVVAPTPDGRTPALAVIGGLALDTALRGAFGTWDLAWQDGTVPWLTTAALLAALGAATVLAWRADLAPSPVDRTWVALALGPTLALEVLFLQNVAAVAGAGSLALAGAAAVVLVADGVAAFTVLGLTAWPPPRSAVAAMTVAAALTAGALPTTTGVRFVALVLLGQVLAAALLARAAGDGTARDTRTVRATVAAGAGGVVLGATLFLYQLHYDRPLPVGNRWLLVGAAVVLGLAALATHPVASTARVPRRALAIATAALAVVGATLVLGIAAGEPDLQPVAAGDALRVATFNVHNAVTRDGQVDLEAIARYVDAVDPDVLVMEEADRGWLLAGTTDVAEWLKRRLGMAYQWAPAADEQMGNLVFHRVPLRDARVVDLPKGDGTMRRSALIARVGPVAGEDVTVVGVHFQNGSSPAHKDTRIRETDVLLDEWGRVPRTVLLGDFNMDPGERDLRHLLGAGFGTTQPTDRCTLKTSNENCVDWILVTDDLEQSPTRVRRTAEFDHNPVFATVRPR